MLGLLIPGLRMGGGGSAPEQTGGGWVEEMDVYVPGAVDMQAFVVFPVNMDSFSAWPEDMETQ